MSNRHADSHGDWVLWWSDYACNKLYLPPIVVSQIEAERQKLEREARAAALAAASNHGTVERNAVAVADDAAPITASHEADDSMHRAHMHEVARHQIFPRIDVVKERIARLGNGFYGDQEHTMRQLKALSTALDRGPMRSVVRRPDWRSAFEDLATELPAYRAVLQVITNALALAEITGTTPSITPILIVGAPGVGKSYFCRRLAQTLGSGSAWIAMDQHTAGADLRGSDSHWSTSRHGALFDLLGLSDTANPLVVLDEIDKAPRSSGTQSIDMLAQLYSALEPETARHLADVSLDVELDASLVMYVATANQLKSFDAALLSRFEVVQVGLPRPSERREAAARVVDSALRRLGVHGAVKVSPGCAALLADFSARVVHRAIEKAVGAAVASGRHTVSIGDMEAALGIAPQLCESLCSKPH